MLKKLSFLSIALLVATTMNVQAKTTITCSETDNGIDLSQAGSINITITRDDKVINKELKDGFSKSRNRYVEFYCKGNLPAYEMVSCPNSELGDQCPAVENLESVPKILVGEGPVIFSDIIVGNQVDVEVLKFKLVSQDAPSKVTKFRFVSNFQDKLTVLTENEIKSASMFSYKLYSPEGRLLDAAEAINGVVEFDLSDRPYQIEQTHTFSLQVDAKPIQLITDRWESFRLTMLPKGSDLGSGIEAVTVDTGAPVKNIFKQNIQEWPRMKRMMNAKSELTLRHAISQPQFADPSVNLQEFYRFTATADVAGDVELKKVTLDAFLMGMSFLDKPNVEIRRVKSDGTLDVSSRVTDSVRVSNLDEQKQSVVIQAILNDQKIPAGSSQTYAVLIDNTVNDFLAESDDDSVSFSFRFDEGPRKNARTDTLLQKSNIVWSDLVEPFNSNRFMSGFLLNVDSTAYINQD